MGERPGRHIGSRAQSLLNQLTAADLAATLAVINAEGGDAAITTMKIIEQCQ